MKDYIVIVKLVTREELIGVIVPSDNDKIVQLETPFAMSYNYMNESVIMHPYCLWSDETLFKFDANQVVFVTPANDMVADRYLSAIDSKNKQQEEDLSPATLDEFNDILDKIQNVLGVKSESVTEPSEDSILVEGNLTKH